MCNFSCISCKRLLYLYINNRILLGLKSEHLMIVHKLLVYKKKTKNDLKKRIKMWCCVPAAEQTFRN